MAHTPERYCLTGPDGGGERFASPPWGAGRTLSSDHSLDVSSSQVPGAEQDISPGQR